MCDKVIFFPIHISKKPCKILCTNCTSPQGASGEKTTATKSSLPTRVFGIGQQQQEEKEEEDFQDADKATDHFDKDLAVSHFHEVPHRHPPESTCTRLPCTGPFEDEMPPTKRFKTKEDEWTLRRRREAEAKSMTENERLMEVCEDPEEFMRFVDLIKQQQRRRRRRSSSRGEEDGKEAPPVRVGGDGHRIRRRFRSTSSSTSGASSRSYQGREAAAAAAAARELSQLLRGGRDEVSQRRSYFRRRRRQHQQLQQQQQQRQRVAQQEPLELRQFTCPAPAAAECAGLETTSFYPEAATAAAEEETLQLVRERVRQLNARAREEVSSFSSSEANLRINEDFQRRLRRRGFWRRALEFLCSCCARPTDTFY